MTPSPQTLEIAGMDQPPCVELGKPMNWCARALREQQIEGRLLLPAEWWKGWKIHRGNLIGPGGMTFDPRLLTALWRAGRLNERRRRRSAGTTSAG
jgi:hypothetical protein